MELTDTLGALPVAPRVVAAGVFDGVHLGHRALIKTALSLAASMGARCTVLTFQRHPLCCLAPDKAPPYLMTTRQRADAIAACGPDELVMLPFDQTLARESAAHFLARLRARGLAGMAMGESFTFGAEAEGSHAWLVRNAPDLPVTVLPKVCVRGLMVSSTAVRTAVMAGDLPLARLLLGGEVPALTGAVARGAQLGRRIGLPTLNLPVDPRRALPPRGVYDAFVEAKGRRVPGIAYLGVKPTVGGETLVLEAHAFADPQAVYGDEIAVTLRHFLRPEARFASLEAMRAQIGRDMDEARRLQATP